jgi:hypothetical protein
MDRSSTPTLSATKRRLFNFMTLHLWRFTRLAWNEEEG